MSKENKTVAQNYIGDVGEKFKGAKKDSPNAIHFDFSKMGSNSEFTKRKLWKRPDFRDDVKGGLNTAKHAILFMVIYDNLNSKPPEGRRFNIPATTWTKAYIESISFLKNAYENEHYESIKQLTEDFDKHIRSLFPHSKQDVERYAAGKATAKKISHPLSMNMESRLRFDCLVRLGWLEDDDVLDTDSFGAIILSDTKTNKKAWYAVKAATPKSVNLLDGNMSFNTFDEAMNLAREIFEKEILTPRKIAAKTLNKRSKPPKRPILDRPFIRQGPNYRNDQPVSIETFIQTFKFRGIEFGNWVTQAERQGFLDATYDAFMDLARIFGLPPTFASLGGTLGIAFGSRGKGSDNAAAHFELNQWLIHLTKTKGVGSLCHEFGHALDAYLAKRNKTESKFLTEKFVQSFKGSRCFTREELYQSPTMKDQLMLPDFTALLHHLLYRDGDRNSHRPSQFAKNALSLDAQNNKMYWADPAELFARAFETWMSDRLVMEGLVNEFLVYGTDKTPSSWNAKLSMYPEGSEREKIVNGMDIWVKSLVSTWTKR